MQFDGMAFVAIGANLPRPDGRSPLDTCRDAVVHLDALPSLRLIGLSRWYLSAPEPPSGQPDYINGVAALRVDPGVRLDPSRLLAHLLAIETRFYRQRGSANAARTLDLDLLAMDDTVRAAPDPILPHPRLHQRGFVLAPLTDVAPDWVHPALGATAAELLHRLGQAPPVLA